MRKNICGFSNIQENTSSVMLPNFDFRQVTTIFSVQINACDFGYSTFSKQMDIIPGIILRMLKGIST